MIVREGKIFGTLNANFTGGPQGALRGPVVLRVWDYGKKMWKESMSFHRHPLDQAGAQSWCRDQDSDLELTD